MKDVLLLVAKDMIKMTVPVWRLDFSIRKLSMTNCHASIKAGLVDLNDWLPKGSSFCTHSMRVIDLKPLIKTQIQSMPMQTVYYQYGTLVLGDTLCHTLYNTQSVKGQQELVMSAWHTFVWSQDLIDHLLHESVECQIAQIAGFKSYLKKNMYVSLGRMPKASKIYSVTLRRIILLMVSELSL